MSDLPAPSQPTPSIGRIVLYRPRGVERFERGGAEVYPAVITRVWSPTVVNLHVLADGGEAFFATSRIMGEGEGGWTWPPRS